MSPNTHPIAIFLTNSFPHRARCATTLLIAGFTAVALTVCGIDGGSPTSSPRPTSSTSIFAGKSGARGTLDGSAGTARFNVPTGVAPDQNGNLYVADSENYTIRKISAGTVPTIAGSASAPGSAEGTGTAASFRGPSNIAISPSGNLYVTDQGR